MNQEAQIQGEGVYSEWYIDINWILRFEPWRLPLAFRDHLRSIDWKVRTLQSMQSMIHLASCALPRPASNAPTGHGSSRRFHVAPYRRRTFQGRTYGRQNSTSACRLHGVRESMNGD